MAVANYVSTYDAFPPAYVADKDGRPMHSWRVLLLPFLEQSQVYNAYNFSEPWDGPNNLKLAKTLMNTFRRPEAPGDSPFTSFVAVVGPRTTFPGTQSVTLKDVSDGNANTILFVEIANSDILWSEPRDLDFDRMSFRVNDPKGHGLGSPYGGARIALIDGTIKDVKDSLRPEVLRALLTISGGETIAPDDY